MPGRCQGFDAPAVANTDSVLLSLQADG
jgi:hypothetical protein